MGPSWVTDIGNERILGKIFFGDPPVPFGPQYHVVLCIVKGPYGTTGTLYGERTIWYWYWASTGPTGTLLWNKSFFFLLLFSISSPSLSLSLSLSLSSHPLSPLTPYMIQWLVYNVTLLISTIVTFELSEIWTHDSGLWSSNTNH